MSSVGIASLLFVALCSADVPASRPLEEFFAANRARNVGAVSRCKTSRCNGLHYDLVLHSDIRLSECTVEEVYMDNAEKVEPSDSYFCKETCKYCLPDDVWGEGAHYGRVNFIRKASFPLFDLTSRPDCEMFEEAEVPIDFTSGSYGHRAVPTDVAAAPIARPLSELLQHAEQLLQQPVKSATSAVAINMCQSSRCNGVHYDHTLKSDLTLSECTVEADDMQNPGNEILKSGGNTLCKETCKYALRDEEWGQGTHYGRLDFVRKDSLFLNRGHCARLEEDDRHHPALGRDVPASLPPAAFQDAGLAMTMFNPFGACQKPKCAGKHYSRMVQADITLSECTIEKGKMQNAAGKQLTKSDLVEWDLVGSNLDAGNYFCLETCKYSIGDEEWGEGSHYGRIDFIRAGGMFISSSPHCERFEEAPSEAAVAPVARPPTVSHDAALAVATFNPFVACQKPKCVGKHYSRMVQADITLSECTSEKGKMKNAAGQQLSKSDLVEWDLVGSNLDAGSYFCLETCKYSIGDEEWGQGSHYGRVDFIRAGGMFIGSPHCESYEAVSSETATVV